MIAGFFNGVKHIIKFNDVASPGAIANVDSSTWNLIDGIVPNLNFSSHRNIYPSGLFLKTPIANQEVVLDETFGRVIIVAGAAEC